MRGKQMNPKYKILKLKSGEELISTIIKFDTEKMSLKYPMVFRSMILPDGFTGMQKEITVLRDWISYTSEECIEIPVDYVLSTTKDHFNEWITVKANVKEHFKKFHNLNLTEISGVAVMTDTDNSKLKAISYYQNIYSSEE